MALLLAPLAAHESERHEYPQQLAVTIEPERIDTLKTDYDALIQKAVDKHLPGMDYRLFKSLLFTESNLNPLAKSQTGALGLAQFMPPTWTEWSVKAGYAGKPATDPEAAIYTGAAYLAYLISKWSSPRPDIDRTCLAMLSYNAGFAHVLTAQKVAKGALLYKDIAASLHKVPNLSAVRIKDGENYARKIYKCYVDEVIG